MLLWQDVEEVIMREEWHSGQWFLLVYMLHGCRNMLHMKEDAGILVMSAD